MVHPMKMRSFGAILFGLLAACGGGGGNSGDDTPGVDAMGSDHPLPSGVTAVPLTSLDGIAYSAPLVFGDQSFDALIDTGSSTTAVASSSCTSCGINPAYTPGSSATDQHQTASTSYGDGSSWQGEIFKDSSSIGEGPAVDLAFASITSDKGFFRGFGFAGIIGLGPSTLLEPHTTSYMEGAISAGMTGQMAFELCPDGGTMWLGGFDQDHAGGDVQFTPVVSGFPYYGVNVGGATVGGAAAADGSDFGPAIIDTGTSISFVPSGVIDGLTGAITASDGYKSVFGSQPLTDMGCVNATAGVSAADIDDALPKLGMTFQGGHEIGIPATKSYLLQQGANQYCFVFSDSTALTGGQFTASLFGDTLLTGMITVVDVDAQKIGFAPQVGCSLNKRAEHQARTSMPHTTVGQPWWVDDPRVRVPQAARAYWAAKTTK